MVYISGDRIRKRIRRYKALNSMRLQHALALMSSHERACLSFLPVLLHYNHVSLAGYRDERVPCGIDLFEPDAAQRVYLQRMISHGTEPLREPEKRSVLGLYAMGSTSSLGQGYGSDLDIWVCTVAGLPQEDIDALQGKCRIISRYAKAKGVELNLFVTPVDRFIDFRSDSMDEENCGSAQNLFLLDEFYRSSVRLCGRHILWYLISTREEWEDYAAYADFLLHGCGSLRKDTPEENSNFAALRSFDDRSALEQSFSYDVTDLLSARDVTYAGENPVYFSSLYDRIEVSGQGGDGRSCAEGSAEANEEISERTAEGAPSDLAAESAMEEPSEAAAGASGCSIRCVFSENGACLAFASDLARDGLRRVPYRMVLTDDVEAACRGSNPPEASSDADRSDPVAAGSDRDEFCSYGADLERLARHSARHADSDATARDGSGSGSGSRDDDRTGSLRERRPCFMRGGLFGAPEIMRTECFQESMLWPLFFNGGISLYINGEALSGNGYAFSPSCLRGKDAPLRHAGALRLAARSVGRTLSLRSFRARPHGEPARLSRVTGFCASDALSQDVCPVSGMEYIEQSSYYSSDGRFMKLQADAEREDLVLDGSERGAPHNRTAFDAPRSGALREDFSQESAGGIRTQFFRAVSSLLYSSKERSVSLHAAEMRKSIQAERRRVGQGGFSRLAEAMGVNRDLVSGVYLDKNAYGETVLLHRAVSEIDESQDPFETDADADSNLARYPSCPVFLEDRAASFDAAPDAAAVSRDVAAPLKAEEWFDFGSVNKKSPAEFFGSGLWLLYKAIDSPFKVVLKILLMESYSNDYPNTTLLSSELKDYMLTHDDHGLDLDAYYLMYRRVERYLLHRKDPRVTLMRKCFYLKIFKGISDGHSYSANDTRMKRGLLDRFAARWRWDQRFVYELESFSNWKLETVRGFYQEVNRTLLQSYRALLMFSVRHGIEYAITSDDVGVLSRKLYAAFDLYPGKIPILHLSFTHSLEERCLTFIRPADGSLCRQGWHLYAAGVSDMSILNRKVFYIGKRLSEVVAWACFNGILGQETVCYAAGDCRDVRPENIMRLGRDLMRMLRPHLSRVKESSLQKAREMQACLVLLNLESDPTVLTGERINAADLESTLCCGRQRLCLIGSVDVVMINSWGELNCISLPDGEEGVVELIATLLRIAGNAVETASAPDPLEQLSAVQLPDNIKICAYASSYADLIRHDVDHTVRQVFRCMSSNNSSEYVFDVGENMYVARSAGRRGVVINKSGVFGSEEFDSRILSRYGMRPEFSLQVPAAVDRYATLGIVQYFFSPVDQERRIWDIFIINERNEVQIHKGYQGSRALLVNAINRYYTSREQEDHKHRSMRFNLPQYFVLNRECTAVHPFTINSG